MSLSSAKKIHDVNADKLRALCWYKIFISAYTTDLVIKYKKEYIKNSIDLILISQVVNDDRTTSKKLCSYKIKYCASQAGIKKEIYLYT